MPPETPNPEPIKRLLLDQAEALSRLRIDLDELASELTDSVMDIRERLDQRESPDVISTPRAWSWRDLGPRAEEELWSQLRAWVSWIRHRYPLAKRIPPCWAEHPEIVEELTALWLAWQQAYEVPEAPLTAASDWHDRWLPGVLHRMEHGPFALNCSQEHRPRPSHLYAASGESRFSEQIATRESTEKHISGHRRCHAFT